MTRDLSMKSQVDSLPSPEGNGDHGNQEQDAETASSISSPRPSEKTHHPETAHLLPRRKGNQEEGEGEEEEPPHATSSPSSAPADHAPEVEQRRGELPPLKPCSDESKCALFRLRKELQDKKASDASNFLGRLPLFLATEERHKSSAEDPTSTRSATADKHGGRS